MPWDSSSTLPSATIFHKTKMCKFHMAGRCMRHDACTYAHSAAELAPFPDFHFTKMCPSLAEAGRCARGVACPFAHHQSELRVPRKAGAQGALPTSTPTAGAPPIPAETLISLQHVLAGMGVVLLQVLPPQKPVKEQGGAGVDGNVFDGDVDLVMDDGKPSVGWSRQSTEEPGLADADGDAGADADSDADWDLVMCDDKPSRRWSRQSTEEDFEEPLGEFSRQSSESSDARGLETPVEKSSELRVETTGLRGHFGGCGLAYTVKRTFLQFDDKEAPPPVLRRALSSGSCALRDA
mmetsp:Transcript_75561/g.175173  ORF Transcript_75561/g.175173 Transcript_75561/m.175173 type:complete len:294 (-) Transcript_75561:120-1001(-)